MLAENIDKSRFGQVRQLAKYLACHQMEASCHGLQCDFDLLNHHSFFSDGKVTKYLSNPASYFKKKRKVLSLLCYECVMDNWERKRSGGNVLTTCLLF